MEDFVRNMAIAAVLDILFPRFCLRCKREGEAWCRVCDEAYMARRPEPACPFCHTSGSDRTCAHCRPDVYLDGVVGIASYADPIVRGALTTWKYHGDRAYADVVGRWIRRSASSFALPPVPTQDKGWAIVPLPLHTSRLRSRGFDQAEAVAREVAGTFGSEPVRALSRIKRTAPQARRGHEQRLVGDLDGAFSVLGNAPPHVLIVDDVFTSGATMDAAAKALKEAGSLSVWGFVVARGS